MEHEIDPYRTLQVHEAAEDIVIQASYRALIKRHHPDRGGRAAVAQRLNAAYALLRDPRLRQAYDRLHRAGPAGASDGRAVTGTGGSATTEPLRPLEADLPPEVMRRFVPAPTHGPGWLFDFAGRLRGARRHRIWMKRFQRLDAADARAFLTMVEATRLARPIWTAGSDLFVAVIPRLTEAFRGVLRGPRMPFPWPGYAVVALDVSARVLWAEHGRRTLRSITALTEAIAAGG